MTLLWRFGNIACTALNKLAKQDDKMRTPPACEFGGQ